MIIATSVIASIALAAVFFQLGLELGKRRGEKCTEQAYNEICIPEHQKVAVREAFNSISTHLWFLRDEIHNLPFDWNLEKEEANFLHRVYCCIPSGIESIMMKVQLVSDMALIPGLDVLEERYVGKSAWSDANKPLTEQDFERVKQGDYSAALYIGKVILAERARQNSAA